MVVAVIGNRSSFKERNAPLDPEPKNSFTHLEQATLSLHSHSIACMNTAVTMLRCKGGGTSLCLRKLGEQILDEGLCAMLCWSCLVGRDRL